MADNIQTYTTRIFLNDTEAQKKIDDFKRKISDLRKVQEQALQTPGKAGDKQWKDAAKQIKAYEAQVKKLSTTSQSVSRVLNDLSGSSVKDLKNTIKALYKELSDGSVKRGSDEWKFLTEQLQRCRAELQKIDKEAGAAKTALYVDDNNKGFFSKTVDFLNENWGALSQAKGAFDAVTDFAQQYVQDFADMEEAMANVRKYTGQTDEEIHAMNEEFKQLDTRTSREQLNELAGAAGRLGITSHDAIMEFVDAADKINVALGDDLGDGAVDQIGKLAMAFGEDENMGLRKAMLATGSAINELSANSASNAGYLVDFAARLAGVGQQAGLTQTQIMGLGAVMDENMQRDETATTALSQLITKMATDTQKFAQLAGVPLEEFSRMVKEDMNGALLAFFDAMQRKGGFTDLAPMFEEMGMRGTQASQVFSVLAGKIEDVRKYQQLANNAYDEGSSVLDEFNTQNETVQAKLDKAQKQFHDLSVELGGALYPVVNATIGGVRTAIPLLSQVIKFLSNNMDIVVTLTAAVAAYKVQMLLANNATKLAAIYEAAHTAAITAKTVAVKVLAGKVSILTVAQHALNAATKAFPGAWIVGIVAALVMGMKKLSDKYSDINWRAKELNKEIEEQNKRYDQQKKRIEALLPKAQDAARSMEDRNSAIRQLKKLAPDYFKDLDTETAKTYNVADALKEVSRRQKEANRLKYRSVIADYNADAAEYKNKYGQDHGKKVENRRMQPGTTDVARMAQQEEKKALGEKRIAALAAVEALRQLSDAEEEEAKPKGKSGSPNNRETEKSGNRNTEKSNNRNTKKSGNQKNEKSAEAIPDEELSKIAFQYSQQLISYDEYLQARKELTRKYITDKKKQEDEMTRLDEEQIERQRVAQAALLKAQYYDPSSDIYQNEAALNEALYENDMDALAARIAAQREGSAEWVRLMAEREQKEADHTTQAEEDLQKQLEEMRKTYLEASAEERMQAELDALEKLNKKKLLKEEEYEQLKKAIRDKYSNTDSTDDGETATSKKADDIIGKAKVDTSGGDKYGVSAFANIFKILKARKEANEELKTLYGEDAENNAEYNEKKKENDQQAFDALVEAANAAYSGLSNIMSAASAYSQACSDYEVAKITANYDKQIDAAGNNSKKKEKLEKQKDEAIAKAKTKASKKSMKMEMAQAVASTAMAAINAYATAAKESLVLAPIAAAMATAAGMIQIATIKKQHQAEEAGYYEGGFTGGTEYRRKAGVVHEGEFVANHKAVANESILPALRLIDYAQRHNTVSTLTGDDVSRALGQGQYSPIVAAPIVNVSTDNSALQDSLDDSRRAIDRLNDRLDSPIEAHISMTELDREQRKWKRLKN